MFDPPFRWNLTNARHLGSLLEGEEAYVYEGFLDELLPCCSRVLAFAGDSDLLFVGRSPESIFDHLSGLLLDTSWSDRLGLLPFSKRSPRQGRHSQHSIQALRRYLRHLDLDPDALARRRRPVALIDLVSRGGTFGFLVTFLHAWCRETRSDWSAVRRKIRLVGIRLRTKNSPNTWRWQQHVAWRPLLEPRAVINVSVSPTFWEFLGDCQTKVTRSYTSVLWGNPEAAIPPHQEGYLRALRVARELFELGRTRERREALAALMAREPSMTESWFRKLVQEVRS